MSLRSWHRFRARGSSLCSQGCSDPGLQEAFPTPVPLGAFEAALPSPSFSGPCQAAHTLVAGVVLLCFTLLGRAWESLQEEGGMGTLSLPGTVYLGQYPYCLMDTPI